MRKLIVDDDNRAASELAAALAIVGIDAFTAPKRAPVRQLTEADADSIAAAQAKRERKAKKRATQSTKANP